MVYRSFLHRPPLNTMFVFIILFIFCEISVRAQTSGKTEITRWKNDKKTAVSITYDDGSIKQFKTALPLMEKMEFAGYLFCNYRPH